MENKRLRRVVRRPIAPGVELPEGLHPLLRRLYLSRGVRSSEDLRLELNALHPVEGLDAVFDAAERLYRAMRAGHNILIVGDYDADGATSCALAVRVLRALGAPRVDYLVPNRFDFGYGLTPEIVEFGMRKQPGLIVTVDNGIASVAGVRRATELGVPVVVTDHHLPGDELPRAAAIVNPNKPGDGFPSKHLAGVCVMFYLLAALRQLVRRNGWLAKRGLEAPNLADYLDLVALGTVADVVPLDRNNRILVEQGLRRIRVGRCCAGVQAMLDVSGRAPARLNAQDLGFALGPRLNAAGRLEDMSVGVECLLADDEERASRLARQLDQLNRQRRRIEADMSVGAEHLLEGARLESRGLPMGVCLYDDSWHQGVIGILAGRIKERYQRPAIAFARSGEGRLKGSARSVPEIHIRDVIDAVVKRQPELIERFGGHAMAAGLTLAREQFPAFAQAFDAEVRRQLGGKPPSAEMLTDGELAPEWLELDTALLLKSAGPWGQGFPEPLFDGRFRLLEQRLVGERHLQMRLQPVCGGCSVAAIAFNQGRIEPRWGEGGLHIVYRLDVNEYLGRLSSQLVVEHLQPASGHAAQTRTAR